MPVEISGSGTYKYGTKVPLTAALTPGMPGLLGLLGGKYVFKQWSGALNTFSSSVILTIAGDQADISIQAMYGEDYSGILFSVVIIVVVIVAVAVLVNFLRRRRRKKPVPAAKPSRGLLPRLRPRTRL